jgi:hypothetical protein
MNTQQRRILLYDAEDECLSGVMDSIGAVAPGTARLSVCLSVGLFMHLCAQTEIPFSRTHKRKLLLFIAI